MQQGPFGHPAAPPPEEASQAGLLSDGVSWAGLTERVTGGPLSAKQKMPGSSRSPHASGKSSAVEGTKRLPRPPQDPRGAKDAAGDCNSKPPGVTPTHGKSLLLASEALLAAEGQGVRTQLRA
ncbi:unnamed protein product [Arctogadus glacialis]